MEEKLEQLKALEAEIYALGSAQSLLGWDQEVNMPPDGTQSRGNAMAALGTIIHEKTTSAEYGKLLEELRTWAKDLEPDSDEARLIKVASRDYELNTKMPVEMVAEFNQLQAAGVMAWREACEKSEFPIFQPLLEKVVDFNRRVAELYKPYDHVYDPLLNRFEPGMKTAEVQEIFDGLRPLQVELIQAISEHPQVDDSFLHQTYAEDKQWKFGEEVITAFGFDWKSGRQDKSTHPFTSGFGPGDTRITTRVNPEDFNDMFFSTVHEGGHAMYDQGGNSAYQNSSLSGGASLGIHESQSRMWENQVARSLPFWEYYFPKLLAVFPGQLEGIDLETFYKGINKVEPSFIRVEADEATYNLHIMLRLEIEIGLMDGSMAVKDLPEIWNDRMNTYLGVTPPNDAQGVLQDIHWSSGMVGYFSTYALGNLISAQLWEQMNKEIPDLSDQMRSGKFEAVLAWNRKHIHANGRKFEPQELVTAATGSTIDPAPYVRYLKNKYGEIYGL